MRRHRHPSEPVTFLARVITGFISACAMAGVLVIVPLVTGVGDVIDLVVDFYGGIFSWAPALAFSALVTGFAAGPKRMARFWGYMFGTEDPARPGVTAAIWIGILVVILIGSWTMG